MYIFISFQVYYRSIKKYVMKNYLHLKKMIHCVITMNIRFSYNTRIVGCSKKYVFEYHYRDIVMLFRWIGRWQTVLAIFFSNRSGWNLIFRCLVFLASLMYVVLHFFLTFFFFFIYLPSSLIIQRRWRVLWFPKSSYSS